MRVWLTASSTLFFVAATFAVEPPKSPLSPEESLKHLVLADSNLVIEIAAAEPEVIDPVSIQFDEHGRMWVVEMRDYPTGPQNAPPPLGGPDAKPLSRIKLLEDKDGDGRFETAHVFAENLLFATGVQPWDGGVIVTHSGEIVYLKDTDGDHKADVREVWFTGFSQQNTQLRANHPTFGPDGWIYVANGLRGGNVIAVKKDWPVKVPSPLAPSGRGAGGEGQARTAAGTSSPLTPNPSPQRGEGNKAKDIGAAGVSHDPANPVPVSLTGRDFKFDPLTGQYEAISGNGQFGMTFDAWGNRFVCDNRHPCRHVIFEEDFIRRCPHVAFPAVVNDVIPPDDKNKVFPLTSAWTTSNLHAGTFTAACGVTVYTGDWLPEHYRGNVFVCEPTGNLVQRAVLEADGVTFKSRNPHERSRHAPRDEPNAPSTSNNKSTSREAFGDVTRSVTATLADTETQEFLASRDDWFRPVDLQNGPDGALYVVDMYRAVIEHPEWVPDELKNRPDTWLGNDKGRIYRIRSSTANRRPLELDLLRAKPFVFLNDDGIDADNGGIEDQTLAGWYRPMASRLLHEKLVHPDGMTVLTEQFVESGRRYRDGQRVLWHPELSSSMWQSPHLSKLVEPSAGFNSEALREAYLRLQRLILKRLTVQARDDWSEPANRDRAAVFAMEILFRGFKDQYDDDAFQLQALQTWHELATSPGTRTALAARIAQGNLRDPWLRQALIATAGDRPAEFLTALVRDGALQIGSGGMRGGAFDFEPSHWEPSAELFSVIGELIGKNAERDIVARSVALLCQPPAPGPMSFQIAASGLLGIGKGITRRVDKWKGPLSEVSIDAAAALANVAPQTIRQVEFIDKDRPHWSLPRRRIAVRLLAQLNDEQSFGRLRQFVEGETDQALRLTALEAFASSGHSDVDTWLLDRYPAETPAIRRAILSALLASKERQLALLGAIADGKIAATEIDPVRAKQLTDAKDEAVREKARQVLAAAAPASRQEVLAAYQPALTLKADPQRGREVFQKNCVTCHRVGDLGVNVAPDISDTRTKKPDQLLLDILDPNRAIDANYFAYAVVTKDGKTESGVIASESSNSITLKQPEGKVLTLLRTDIEELRNTGLSLMPVGVEKNINQQQMADLIFWLKNWRYLDGKVPATSLK